MKTLRLIALLAMAALAACADPITAPVDPAETEVGVQDGTGFLGGGTRADP